MYFVEIVYELRGFHNVPEQKKYGINYFGNKKGTRDRVKGTEFIYATDFS